MADKRDYYEVLGIDKNASEQDIKKAFRQQAKNITLTYIPVIKRLKQNLKK